MTTQVDRLEQLRRLALIAVIIGSVGSISLLFLTGANPPLLIVVGFIVWVLAPWALLLWANFASQRWRSRTRIALYAITFVIAVASLAIYARDVASPPQTTRAFWWVTIPPVSFLLAILTVGTARLLSPGVSTKADQN